MWRRSLGQVTKKPLIRFVLATSLLAGCMALASCQSGLVNREDLSGFEEHQIRDMQRADVKKDLDAAIGRRDFRMIGLAGPRGPVAPGINDESLPHIKKIYGLRVIDNATIDPSNDVEQRLMVASWVYAEKYNTLMLKEAPSAGQ